MFVELTGVVRETFTARTTPTQLILSGDNRARSISVEWPTPWQLVNQDDDAVGADFEHPAGARAKVRVYSGQRIRLELLIENSSEITVPGPQLVVDSIQPAIAWLAGASGEVVIPTESGPALLTQRRGMCTPGEQSSSWYPLGEEVRLWSGHLASSAWTYEAFAGDIWDIPAEPTWLPLARCVPLGQTVELSAPDGRIDADCAIREDNGEFEISPPAGITEIAVWSAAGRTSVEVGAFWTLAELRERVVQQRSANDESIYVAVRYLLESWLDEELLDWVDRRLADAEDSPSAWLAAAAHLSTGLGLPLAKTASQLATEVLAKPRPDDIAILALHGLVPVQLSAAGWPVGDIRETAVSAVNNFGYGRISNSGLELRGRDIAWARIFIAGLGENDQALKLSSYTQAAENHLMCQLSAVPVAEDVAWLSLAELGR